VRSKLWVKRNILIELKKLKRNKLQEKLRIRSKNKRRKKKRWRKPKRKRFSILKEWITF